jgi:hypothetical protein
VANHHTHALWDASDPEGIAKRLKATIRVSVPEAKQQEDEQGEQET